MKAKYQDCVKNSGLALTFDLSDTLGYPLQLTIDDWHSAMPLYWQSYVDHEVVAQSEFLESPGLPLVTVYDQQGRVLTESIPSSLVRLSEVMPGLQYEVLQSCAVSRPARQLAEDCPLLLLMVVNEVRKVHLSEQAFKTLTDQPRSELLGYIGLARSKSMARLIRRIKLDSFKPWEIDSLLVVLNNQACVDLLRHCDAPHLNHLRLLRRHQQPLWPALLDLVDANTTPANLDWLCRMLQDVLHLANGHTNPLRQVRTFEQLQTMHDRLVDRFNEAQRQQQAADLVNQEKSLSQLYGPYPTGPIPDSEVIQGISSWQELIMEGIEMHHCVGSYGHRVANGTTSIYRMDNPQRLTIALAKRGTRWVLDEVRGKYNASPAKASLEVIHTWADALNTRNR